MLTWLAQILHSEFLNSAPVQTALLVGSGAAVVSAVIGVFTILRGQAFAGHALGDISSAGGSASFLLNISPLVGFLGIAAIAAVGMEFLGVRKIREQDIATGIVFGAGLGLSSLLLYFDITSTSTTGAAVTVMFGSIFALSPDLVWPALIVAAIALATIALLYRPMLLSVADTELAVMRGISIRWVGLLQLLTLAVASALGCLTVGSLLATALLLGPAGAALHLCRKPGVAILWAVALGLLAVWVGIWMAYESYYWFPTPWPVSFFVVAIILMLYLLSVPCQYAFRKFAAARTADNAGS
ncbi:MAG TPA: metal ABC transporter permease [Phycisphaerae bacterium]|nr:metal ABC transporter permease [Phycisphaerae bacterium]